MKESRDGKSQVPPSSTENKAPVNPNDLTQKIPGMNSKGGKKVTDVFDNSPESDS